MSVHRLAGRCDSPTINMGMRNYLISNLVRVREEGDVHIEEGEYHQQKGRQYFTVQN